MRERLTYRLYAVAWGLVRRLPERVAYRLFDLVADLVWRSRRGPVLRLEANLRRARPDTSYDELRALSRAGAALLPALLVRGVPAAGLEQGPRGRDRPGRERALPARRPGRRAGGGRGPDAHGQLGPRRRVGLAHRGARGHGGRAAASRAALRPLPRLPRGARDGDPAADRGRRRPPRHAVPAAARRPARAAARRPRPAGQRHPRRPARASPPGCRPARRCSPCAPGRRCTR